MGYPAIVGFVLVLVIALLWDVWTPASGGMLRRPGAPGIVLSIAASAAALLGVLVSAPGALVAALLALALLSGAVPLARLVSLAKAERARGPRAPGAPRVPQAALPESLVDADPALKRRYDDLLRQFEATAGGCEDPTLVEHGRRLADELHRAARTLGTSRALEMSKDIPALTYWAADLARRSYPAGDERLAQLEQSLHYYRNFESTAWLWERYQHTARG